MTTRPHLHGFTLLEVAMVLLIVGFVGSLALPAFGEAVARHHLRAAADELLGTLQKARATAVWRDHPTRVCASEDGRTCSAFVDWTRGWIGRDIPHGDVFAATPHLHRKLTTTRRPGRQEVDFTSNGTAPGANQTLVLCVRGRPDTALAIAVSNAGLPHRTSVTPDDAAACANRPSRSR